MKTMKELMDKKILDLIIKGFKTIAESFTRVTKIIVVIIIWLLFLTVVVLTKI